MHNEIIKSSLPNISAVIHLASQTPNEPGRIVPPHYHDELEILYVTSGIFECSCGADSYFAEKDDILFINSRVVHSTITRAPNTSNHLLQFSIDNFANEAVSGISRYLVRFINLDKDQVVLFKSGEPRTNELQQYVQTILEEYKEKKPAYELYIKSNILNIIAFLSRYSILTDSSQFFNEKNVEKVLPLLTYIDEHYYEPIQLNDLCRIANLNPSYLCRLFKKATNSTFVEYLNFVRICKAEHLLSSTSKSISDISLRLGFASVSYFNKIFKKFKNCTPTEYRNNKYALK